MRSLCIYKATLLLLLANSIATPLHGMYDTATAHQNRHGRHVKRKNEEILDLTDTRNEPQQASPHKRGRAQRQATQYGEQPFSPEKHLDGVFTLLALAQQPSRPTMKPAPPAATHRQTPRKSIRTQQPHHSRKDLPRCPNEGCVRSFSEVHKKFCDLLTAQERAAWIDKKTPHEITGLSYYELLGRAGKPFSFLPPHTRQNG